MPFPFTCPHCFKKTFVEDKYAGQTGPCACCGKVVTLPEIDTTGRPSVLSSRTVFVSERLASSVPSIVGDRSSASSDSDDIVEAALAPPSDAANLFPASTVSSRDTALGPPSSASIASPMKVKAVSQTGNLEAYRRRRLWISLATLATLLLVGVGGWYSFQFIRNTPVIQNLQERRNRMMSLNNTGKIARALNAYAAQHGTYPPSVVYDENGKPKHSWRVLILPHLGEYGLYNSYKFDEPWDSQTNSLIFSKCPSVFTSPSVNPTSTTAEANCFLITGTGTLFPNQPGKPPLAPREVGDGLSSTFLLIECANPIHEWTKPIDFVNGGGGPIKFGGCYNDGTAAAKADGTAIWIPLSAAPESLRAFTSPNGGEDVNPELFKP